MGKKRRFYQGLGAAVLAVIFLAAFSAPVGAACNATFTAAADQNDSMTVKFDAEGSEGETFDWNYGDGTKGTGKTSTHTYEHSRIYAVTLTVKGAEGCKKIKIKNVKVECQYQPGDVDGSGKVDIFDALTIAEFNVGIKFKADLKGFAAGDTNGDGNLDINDCLLVAKFDVKIVVSINWNQDEDGDGYTVNQGDLDDEDDTIYPGADEICGDGIDQDCDGSDLVCTKEGTFFCGLIEGLGYSTETQSGGVTDSTGKFQYIEGETVKFFIGGIVIAEVKAKEVIKPLDMVTGATDETNPTLINIGRLLLTLDDDDNSDNGILISELVRNNAKNLTVDFKVAQADFENNVQELVKKLTAFRTAGKRLLVFADRAQTLMQICIANEGDYLTDNDEDGFTKMQGDCDDENPDIYPEAKEICGDGIDQDCDGNDLVCTSQDVVALSNGYEITFLEVVYNDDNTSSWRYSVKETEAAQDLSNWVLELPECVTVKDASPAYELVKPDPNSELNGIKWETSEDFKSGEFTVKIEGHLDTGKVQVAAKGPDVVKGEITGPACETAPDDKDEDGYTIAEGDCDDNKAEIHPGAEEICGDGIDQDCDGSDLVCTVEPEDGNWSGKTNQEHPVKFKVSEGYVSAIFAKFDYDDQADICVGTNTLITGESQIEIADGKFAFSTSDVEVIGTFTDAKTCKGTWSYKNAECQGTGSGTWEAILDEEISSKDTDDDEDGITENEGDCNDDDNTIFPDAEEVCGDGKDQNCDEEDSLCEGDDTEIKEGIFVFAGALVGIGYKTDTLVGVTDKDGKFKYLEGETVTFFIGSIILGKVQGKAVVTPSDLVEDAEDQTNITVINICSLLLTLDDDDNPDNGIVISKDVRYAAIGISIDFEVSVSDFTKNVQEPVYLLTFCRTAGVRLLVISVKAEFYLNLTAKYTDDDNDGYTELEGDCNDEREDINPGVEEVCEDEETDFNCDGTPLCISSDEDNDKDGFTKDDGDCDDTKADINPEAEDICGDGIDQDCDGSDLVCVVDSITNGDWAGKTSQDYPITFTVVNNQVTAISVKMDYMNEFSEGCVGTNKLITGDAVKVKIVDNSFTFSTANLDISGTFVSSVKCKGTWYYKNMTCDGVGIGTWEASISEESADGDGDGFTVEQGDCDDTNASVYPGAAEICGDGIDQDCSGDDLVCIDDDEDNDDAGIFSLSLNCSNPVAKYKAVYITVKDVQLKRDKKGWVTIASPNKTYSLCSGDVQQLITEKLKSGIEGKYREIRLILSETPDSETHPFGNYVIDAEDNSHELKLKGLWWHHKGIKIKHKFTIVKNETTELVLTFNISKSIKVDKHGKKWELKPSIKVSSSCTCDDNDDDNDDDDDDEDDEDDD